MIFPGSISDLPAFYKECEGCVISTSINKYMYVTIHPYFDPNQIVLKYSRTEIVDSIEAVDHKILKSVLRDFNLKGLEITSIADVPSGTGLGSSSSFTVGLLHSLYCYVGKYVSKERLASEACETEIESVTSSLATIVLGVLVSLFCLFFFLKDGRQIWLWVISASPRR